MERKVYVKRYTRDGREIRDERPYERRECREFKDEKPRERHHNFEHDEFRRPRPDHHGMGERPRVFHKHLRNPQRIQKTKMFTSKKELVDYVNSIGDEGHKIDVYKIEDDLYKVVIVEDKKIEEIEVEIDEDIDESIDVIIEKR